jgi:hypothetical protein
MIYVFDSDALINLFRHYFLKRFPTLWTKFHDLVSTDEICSVKEVYNEVVNRQAKAEDRLSRWARDNPDVFARPSREELEFVTRIFRVPHFQALVRKKEQMQGKPVADPFLIARAHVLDHGCVVTEEKDTPNAARIPNVCRHFKVPCKNLEEFMEQKSWEF